MTALRGYRTLKAQGATIEVVSADPETGDNAVVSLTYKWRHPVDPVLDEDRQICISQEAFLAQRTEVREAYLDLDEFKTDAQVVIAAWVAANNPGE